MANPEPKSALNGEQLLVRQSIEGRGPAEDIPRQPALPAQRWLAALYLRACDLLYSRLAPCYDSVSQIVSLGQWDAWRRSVLPWVEGDAVLEIGYGTGALLGELARRANRVDDLVAGLEPSIQMQRVAGRRLRANGLRVARVRAVAQAIPFPPSSFDSVVSTFPAPYIVEPATLAEIARVLRPGARLAVAGLWVTSRKRLAGLVPLFFGQRPERLLREMESAAAAAGMTMEVHEVTVAWAGVGVVVCRKADASQ